MNSKLTECVLVLVLSGLALSVTSACRSRSEPEATSRTFSTPEEAVRALQGAAKAAQVDELVAIFGPGAKDVVDTSDPQVARRNLQVFTVAMTEGWHLVDQNAGAKTLIVGNESWPFPIPLVSDAGRWRFDTAAGKEEVVARRIGRNELAVIEICRTYVTAQHLYAERGHDGQPAKVYARIVRSDEGRENGLYWASSRGQKRSPLGDLVAHAAEEGVALDKGGAQPSPFHGYYFRILTSQGNGAPGGVRDYVVNNRMTGGFALVAWPAIYDASGVMTFIVNQDGTIYQQDLGPSTDAAAKAMSAYDPDSSWEKVQ
jgi:hypothetical protein